MFLVDKFVSSGNVRCLLTGLGAVLLSADITASMLSLEAAEDLALVSDPVVKSVQANRLALEEMSIAAGQLPDPLLKMGLVSLPTDTFNLGQEPMTQVQFGVMQKFPRGNSRELQAEQLGLKSQGFSELARDRQLQTLLSVREHFVEVLKYQKLAQINEKAIGVFSDLADITEDYYATGRVQQQDVLQAAVELAKVRDRATRITQSEEQARARLAMWIGEAAFGGLDTAWPRFEPALSADRLKDRLRTHPRVRMFEKSVDAAETGVEIARQKYRPEFALDVTYGGRGGLNPDGSSRTDLMTFMVVMDVPIFHKNRQDRVVASHLAEASAAMYSRDDLLRRMSSEIDFHSASLTRQGERISLFESTLIPEAEFSAESSLGAYQSSIESLITLLRARITEFDLQLEYIRLQAEMIKTQARLLYLQGE